MTQKEIIAKRKGYLEKIRELNLKIKHVQIDLQALQAKCPHPNMRGYTERGGSSCSTCDDCGYDQ